MVVLMNEWMNEWMNEFILDSIQVNKKVNIKEWAIKTGQHVNWPSLQEKSGIHHKDAVADATHC